MMARKGLVESNKRKEKLVKRYMPKRQSIKKQVGRSSTLSFEEKFRLRLQLVSLPRSSSPSRVRNRCAETGRARSYYRKFGLSRIAMRSYALSGKLPGVAKSSW